MLRRLFPPLAIGFVVFGVVFLAICLRLNTVSFGCSVNCPQWYANMPMAVQCFLAHCACQASLPQLPAHLFSATPMQCSISISFSDNRSPIGWRVMP